MVLHSYQYQTLTVRYLLLHHKLSEDCRKIKYRRIYVHPMKTVISYIEDQDQPIPFYIIAQQNNVPHERPE